MKKRLAVFLAVLGMCGSITAMSEASDIPDALKGIDLTKVEQIDDTTAGEVRGEAWSPNKFSKGQCTWYVDGRVKEDSGWVLKFSKKSGRNAYKWWDMVTNAKKGQLGYHGDILVLDKWNTNRYGHVAFVESSSPGKSWKVSHANWGGTYLRTVEGVRIARTTFNKVSSGKVNAGGSAKYPLRGFLYRK